MNARPDCVVGELGLKSHPRPPHLARGQRVRAAAPRPRPRQRRPARRLRLGRRPAASPTGDPRLLLREAVQPSRPSPARSRSPRPPLQQPPGGHRQRHRSTPSSATPSTSGPSARTPSPPSCGAAAMGRMRWLAGRLGDRAQLLRKWLDPEFRPPVDTSRNTAAAQLEQLRAPARRQAASRSRPAAADPKATLGAWLVRAFDVFNTPEIAALVDDAQRAQAQNLDDDALPDADRRLRRRLRDLKRPPPQRRREPTPRAEADDSHKIEPPAPAEPARRARRPPTTRWSPSSAPASRASRPCSSATATTPTSRPASRTASASRSPGATATRARSRPSARASPAAATTSCSSPPASRPTRSTASSRGPPAPATSPTCACSRAARSRASAPSPAASASPRTPPDLSPGPPTPGSPAGQDVARVAAPQALA
jgi:hypothetical protein